MAAIELNRNGDMAAIFLNRALYLSKLRTAHSRICILNIFGGEESFQGQAKSG